jgi:glycine cleavage system aminomethyltransferase T
MSQEIIRALRASSPGVNMGWRAAEHTSWQDEQMSWKTTCYIGDWSFLMDLEVEGPDALNVFRDSSVNSFEKFSVGQAKHVIQCNRDGKVIVEGVLMRTAENRFRVQSGPAPWTQFLLSKGGYNATSRKLDTFQFQISGPNALALCEQLAGESLRDIQFMHFREIHVAGKRVYALRQGMAGEIGFELHGEQGDAETVHEAVFSAGQALGIRKLGRRTAMINHLEAAFPTGLWHYLNDMFSPDCEGFREFVIANWDRFKTPPTLVGSFEGQHVNDYLRSPFELGWGKSVKFDHPFTGRAALEKEAASPKKNRVTLEWNSDDVIDIYASLFREGPPFDFLDIPHPQRWMAWADKIVDARGRVIGISSSPGYSYFYRRVLSLSYIDIAFSTPGTQVELVWGQPGGPQKTVRATVHPAPYKPDRRRAELGRAAAAAGNFAPQP